jgi:ATP-dependent Clp protease adaptor protein ClpS
MPEHQDSTSNESTQPKSPDTETPKAPVATKTPSPTRQPNKTKPGKLPPWKVVLHNDPVNTMQDVVLTIKMLTQLSEQAAVRRMLEAHTRGRSMLLTTHRERAELYKDQFASRGLTVTIGPA